jgi:alanyl-tRNA synthetase
MKHHSATHLLHDALRRVLGNHVAQAGSLVSPERLRFDFSHPQTIGGDDVERIEDLVNGWVQEDSPVSWKIVPIKEARASGATMLFGEKYGDEVRMVKMAESLELCGGTHVARTGEIGSFLIVNEEAVSAGVRRIEALAGMAALAHIQGLRQNSMRAAQKLGSKPDELEARIDKLQQDLKTAQREASQLRDKLAAAQTSGGAKSQVQEAGGFAYSTLLLEGLDAAALRNAADNFLQTSKADIIVVASEGLLVAKASKEAIARGAHAGNLIREVAKRAGGGGGGRPDMAQAGVKDASQVSGALAAVGDILAA